MHSRKDIVVYTIALSIRMGSMTINHISKTMFVHLLDLQTKGSGTMHHICNRKE